MRMMLLHGSPASGAGIGPPAVGFGLTLDRQSGGEFRTDQTAVMACRDSRDATARDFARNRPRAKMAALEIVDAALRSLATARKARPAYLVPNV
jgi:hypothetical protein